MSYRPCLLILFCDIQLSLKYIHTGQTEMLCSHLGNAYSILKALTRSGKAWFMSSSGYFLSSSNIWVTRLFFSTATRYNVKRKLSIYKKKPDLIIKCLFVKVGILLTCETYFHYRIISLRVDVWVHRTSLIPLLFKKNACIKPEK